MMDLKRILELAVDGARANWLDAIDALRRNPSSKNMLNRETKEAELRQINKMQQSYKKFMTDLSHSTLHEAFDEIDSIRNDTSESKFVPEYIVQVDINDSVPRPDKTHKFFFATLDETKETYFKYKNMAEALPQIYHVRLFEHIRKGQMILLAEAGKPAPAADSTSKHGYQILITHKSGDIQTLHFDDIRAAKAAFELMKYEIKANRIIYANLLYCIGDTFKKQLDYANRMTVAKEA